MQIKHRVAILVILTPFAASMSPGLPQFTIEKLNGMKRSVVRIDANQCSNTNRTATGFFWSKDNWVVTALHVVNGCTSISIYSESAGKTASATVFRALRREDLALLQLNHSIDGTQLLEAAAETPSLTEDLQTLGYPLSIPRIENTTLRLRYGGRRLRDIVPQEVASELSSLGSPSPDIEITDIEGHLLPGHSGAPIFNSTGKLVAIADGGLENGAAGASWGLPASNLARLASSSDPVGGQTPRSGHLFAAETDVQNGPTIACSTGAFRKIRTLAFADILHATDDPLGLQEIVGATGPAASSLRYDVYQDSMTGATFVIPTGGTVSSHSGVCVVASATGAVTIRVALTNAPNDPMGQQASTRYELAMLGAQGWQIDPAWSYPNPIHRFDDLWTRRKSLVHFGFYPSVGLMMDANFFETLADRKDVFLGVSALNNKWTPAVVQTQLVCRPGNTFT